MKTLTTVLLTLFTLNGFADERDEKILNDFGLAPERITVRHVPEEGLETILNPDGEPIPVKLETGVERRLVFPQPVMVGVENGMSEALRIQNVDRTVFLSAMTAIAHTRLLVRHVDGSRTYVLNVTTEGVMARHTALMISPDAPEPAVVKTVKATPVVPRLNRPPSRDQSGYAAYVRLTRFAAQQIYGPARLANADAGMTREDSVDATTSVAIIRGDQVLATPIASWTDGVYVVTALKLSNTTADSVILDPRSLRGRWLAATFHNNALGGQGRTDDVSALYVVSDQSFDQALGSVR